MTETAEVFRPCVIIPVYDHWRKLPSICEKILSLKLPCLLINDGSGDECTQALQKLADTNDDISLLHNTINSGKGVAVCRGLRWCYDHQFSHAIQIDADGQHNADDIPAFIQLALAHPHAVISGERRYSSVPKSRRYGRRVTDVWVWINTLSFTIKDSMCGYRLYPLAPTMALLNQHDVGKRMDFDSDILVRLYWQGLEIRHVPTQVTYAAEIPSHFDVLRDNIRISRMHATLFFGMLWRSPTLIKRNLSRHASY